MLKLGCTGATRIDMVRCRSGEAMEWGVAFTKAADLGIGDLLSRADTLRFGRTTGHRLASIIQGVLATDHFITHVFIAVRQFMLPRTFRRFIAR